MTDIPLHNLCRCANCGAESNYEDHDIGEIDDLLGRIDPGGTVPAGECTKCHALTYLVQNPYRRDQALLLRRAAAVLEAEPIANTVTGKEIIEELLVAADEMYPEVT